MAAPKFGRKSESPGKGFRHGARKHENIKMGGTIAPTLAPMSIKGGAKGKK